MTDRKRQAEPNAGAFLGPDVLIPVPMGTLGTDYPPDAPTDREAATDRAAASTDGERPSSRLARLIRRIADRRRRTR